MKNFFKVGHMNIGPLAHALARQPNLWNQNDLRTTFPGSPHVEADDIWLWFNDLSEDVKNDIQTRPYPAWDALPQARPIIFDLMRATEASQLGRVVITRLRPGAVIHPHADQGAPAEFYQRYQVAIQSLPGAVFQIETEKVTFEAGDIWLINNRAEHSVTNNSPDDRIVMIVDLKSA